MSDNNILEHTDTDSIEFLNHLPPPPPEINELSESRVSIPIHSQIDYSNELRRIATQLEISNISNSINKNRTILVVFGIITLLVINDFIILNFFN